MIFFAPFRLSGYSFLYYRHAARTPSFFKKSKKGFLRVFPSPRLLLFFTAQPQGR